MSDDISHKLFPKTPKGKLAYMQHLRKRLERNPENFVLLEGRWHTLVDAFPNQSVRIQGLSRIKEIEWHRLKIVVDKTERKVKKKQHYKRN